MTPESFGVLEATGLLLQRLRMDPNAETTELALTHLRTLGDIGLTNEAELVLSFVAIRSELVLQEAITSAITAVDNSLVDIALTAFFSLAVGATERHAGGLQTLLLGLGPSLAVLADYPEVHRVDKVVRLVAHVAGLRADGDAIAALVERSLSHSWSVEARKDVIIAAQRTPRLPADVKDLVRALAEALLADSELSDDAKDQLRAGLDAVALAADEDVSRTTAEDLGARADRLIQAYSALMGSGDYAAAAGVAVDISSMPDLVGLIGQTLNTLAQLHLGTFDDRVAANQILGKLAITARLPESIQMEQRHPLTSAGAVLRAFVADRITAGSIGGVEDAASALEIIADSRIARTPQKTFPSSTALLASVAIADRSPEPTDLILDVAKFAADNAFRVVHVGELVLDNAAAVIASTVIDSSGGSQTGELRGVFGPEHGNLVGLLDRPKNAERLTPRELTRLRNAMFGGIDLRPPVLLVPTPRLWALPFEAIVPESEITLSLRSWRHTPIITPPAGGKPLVVHAADLSLKGARAERTALEQLRAEGRVDLVSPRSLAHLESALHQKPVPDVLILSGHGTNRGITYQVTINGGQLPIHELTSWPLPPLVIAASCHSGAVGENLTLASILNANTNNAIVGLWDIDDQIVGAAVGRILRALTEGTTVRQAFRTHISGFPTSGLRLLSRPQV